jgi:uncharacterized FAD-dependent dehydrogenase
LNRLTRKMEIVEITLTPEEHSQPSVIRDRALHAAGADDRGQRVTVIKSSIDARKKPLYRLQVAIHVGEEEPLQREKVIYPHVQDAHVSAVIVGTGPAGLFCALKCIEKGIKPILLERGKDVRERRRDLAKLIKEQEVDPDSNYCFGEGGAGTYSDGKLYTRSTKRGDVKSILHTLVRFGASERILVESHPHIGTNKLPQMIANMREFILEHGGEIHFNTRVTSLLIQGKRCLGVKSAKGQEYRGTAVVLATGHSARDVYEMLYKQGVALEFKPFALGVRVEHPQHLIDQLQYHCESRGIHLPPASYSWVEQVDGRGVYSFCMCPGGIIAPCATAPGEVVTNGWSPSKRNNPWANSGIVVPVEWEDLRDYHVHGPLAGMYFQQDVEQLCWEEAGETQQAPAQRLIDFVNNRTSKTLPACSYLPGVKSLPLHTLLPPFIVERLQRGFMQAGKKMKGYLDPEAIVVAPESRTSSPVRIPRDSATLMHIEIEHLYPSAEGAGYAGGIISAAIDGERVAEALSLKHAII